jgi:hypothetical protein
LRAALDFGWLKPKVLILLGLINAKQFSLFASSSPAALEQQKTPHFCGVLIN